MSAEFLKKVVDVLRSGKPLEERLRTVTAEAGAFISGGIVSILLFDHDTGDFYQRSTTLRLPPNAPIHQFSSAGTIEELALRERRPVHLGESRLPAGSRLRGDIFLLPLISSDEPLGVLIVQSVSAEGIPEEAVNALLAAAGHLSDAVRASLREESASLRMTKIAAINEAGINIISTLDLARLLKLVATSACLIMEAESCVIRLLDGQTGKYGIREFYGMKEEMDQKELFGLDKKVVTEVLKGASSVLVREVGEEEGWKEFAGVSRTLLCFPLKSEGEVIGTVTIFDKFPHKTFYPASFNADDQGTFEKYIRYVEKAITNAISFERNERLKNLDGATGLPTLPYFQARLLHELSRAKRFKRRLVLMICEISPRVPDRDFSAYNKGEWIVTRLSKVIRGSLREYDVVARISEWKFGMILPEAEDGKISAIPRIKKAISAETEQIRRRIGEVKVDLRFGHASFPEDADDHEKLIFKANILKS